MDLIPTRDTIHLPDIQIIATRIMHAGIECVEVVERSCGSCARRVGEDMGVDDAYAGVPRDGGVGFGAVR